MKNIEMSSRIAPRLSVVMCTYNPRPDLLFRSLRSIAAQSLDSSKYELIIVDNNSTPPLNKERLERLAGREVKLHIETRQGLTFGRVCGFENAIADRICFIDDDNELHSSYLETVLAIADKEPELGVYGGICHGVFEKRVGWLQSAFLPHLGVRDLGTMERTGDGDKWGEHEPIGAGIVVRKECGKLYCDFVNYSEAAAGLGRSGKHLLSGEDSLLSRISFLSGFKVAYRPDLQLRHHITSPRLKLKYLKRLMDGHGRSYVNLERIMGREVHAVAKNTSKRTLIKNFLFKLRNNGIRTAYLAYFWDKGFQDQSRSLSENQETLLNFLDTRKIG